MICCMMTMDILLHVDNNLFMFIKSKNLITRNLIPKQQQQQQQQNPPSQKIQRKHTTYTFWKSGKRANFLKVKSSCWVCIGKKHTDESQKSFQ